MSEVATEPQPRRKTPPWLFLFGGTAYGVTGAVGAQIMPYQTSHSWIDLGKIGWFGSLMLLPSIFQFLYAPIVDVGPPRKIWLVATAILSGLSLIAAFSMKLPDHVTAYLVFAVSAAVFAALISACNGALIAKTVADNHRGAASAWYNVGNLSGGGIAGWLGIYMLGRHAIEPGLGLRGLVKAIYSAGGVPSMNDVALEVGLAVGAITILPALVMLLVMEPPREHDKKVTQVLGETLSEVGKVMTSKTALAGMALCISPVATCALVNYFSGMTDDFGVSADVAAAVSGGGSVILTAIGALAGGYLADRMSRKGLYLACGVATAICALIMAASPRVELTYAIGVGIYNLITGVGYAVFTAFVLETIGDGGKSAATRYTMYVSAANFAITYVGWVDTRFHDTHGIAGVLVSDAALNVAGVIVLGFVFWRLAVRRRQGRSSQPVMPEATVHKS